MKFSLLYLVERFLFGSLLFLICHCASPPEKVSSLQPNGRMQRVEAAAQPQFVKAERAFNQKQYETARRLYQAIRARFPHGRAALLSTYRLGTIFYYEQQYPLASREFENFLSHHPNSDLTFDVTYNAAAAEFEQGRLQRARDYLAQLHKADIDAQGLHRAEIVYALSTQIAEGLNDHEYAVAAYAARLQLPQDQSTRAKLIEKTDTHLAKLSSRPELERLLAEVREPSTRQKVSVKLASLTGESPRAEATQAALPMVVGRPGDAAAPAAPDQTNIGVILPLSGKFAPYGHKALEGILLASQIYQTGQDSKVSLFVEDSASSPALARLAVDRLVNDGNVQAIIGPLSYKEALAVGERSQELGVANLSLSAKEGISEKGTYLFQNALTPRIQLDSLVSFCVKNRRMTRFAILYPNDNFGKDMANQFWDLVEKYGAHVVAASAYAPNQQDFQQLAKELGGLDDPKLRKYESTKLWEYINKEKARTRKEPKVRLPPIIDFDAIFIPDSPKRAAQISASLTYFDISGVPLLGTTEWNSDQLYGSGGKYVEGALFPGVLNPSLANPNQKEFFHSFTTAFGSSPDLLAGQAYEAMRLVVATSKATGGTDRGAFASTLASVKEFPSPLGSLSFDTSRVAQRKLQVFSLQAGGVIVPQVD